MFRFIGLAEEAGTGIPSILKAWRELGYHMPRISVGTERYEFQICLRHAHLLSDDDRQWLANMGTAGLSEAAQLALVIARHGAMVDNPTLREVTELHPADVTKELSRLRQGGLLELCSSGRGAFYILTERALAVSAEPGQADPACQTRAAAEAAARQLTFPDMGVEVEDGSRVPGEQSLGDRPASLGDSGASLGDSGASLGDSGASLGDKADVLVGNEARLLEIAAPARAQSRLSQDEMDQVIMTLCETQPLSINQLADIVDRRPDHVRRMAQRLVAEGRLMMLYPEQPRHPRQRYTAAGP